jgi:hypothetical protein
MLQQGLAISPYSAASRRRVRATSHPADRSVSERNEMRNRRGQTLLVFNADPIEGAASYFPPRDDNGQPLAEGLQVPGCRADCRLMMRPATLLSIERAMKALCFAISSPGSPNITDRPRAQKIRSTAARIPENTGPAPEHRPAPQRLLFRRSRSRRSSENEANPCK